MSSQTLMGGISQNNPSPKSKITTYGALILPFDAKKLLEENKPKTNPKSVNDLKGKLRSALKLSNDENLFLGAVKSPIQTFNTLSEYMKDERSQMSKLTTVIGSKFSGIAVAQALANGKVTSKEALDYLFMGFAPALGITGSLFGYSGLTQLKDALSNGSINVGSFLNGFTRTLKGVVDLKDNLSKKNGKTSGDIIEFDLTISHTENYQSETPDRRVQNGQSLNEYIHNMPDGFEVQCALQEGKRYSKPEFRAIMMLVRDRKEVVSLVLGEEIFDSLIITNFSPTNDCSKSGMDYNLSFKEITRSDIDTKTQVIISTKPEGLDEDINKEKTGKLSGSKNKKDTPNTKNMDKSINSELSDSSYGKNTQGYVWTTTYWDLRHNAYEK